MKKKWFIYICFFTTFVSTAVMFYALSYGPDAFAFKVHELFGLAFGSASFFSGIVYSMQTGMKQSRESIHQSIGGYVPSKSLNELVTEEYKNENQISKLPKTNFVGNEDKAKLLLDGLVSDFDENIARGIFVCTITHNGVDHIAKSASKEMSICIAFLKYRGVLVDKYKEE